ncbi:MAG: hypothetical protein Q7S73_01320 [bacterium]|nr:hypothetical protein [bacterium]
MKGTIFVAVAFLLTAFTITYSNLSASLAGFLAAIIVVIIYFSLAHIVLSFLVKKEKKTASDVVGYSSESLEYSRLLFRELSNLVDLIALESVKHQEVKVVSPNDMRIAFELALAEIKKEVERYQPASHEKLLLVIKSVVAYHTPDELGRMLRLRSIRELGLPPDIIKEIKKHSSKFPIDECLLPHELEEIENNPDYHLEDDVKKHVLSCEFCTELISETKLGKELKKENPDKKTP